MFAQSSPAPSRGGSRTCRYWLAGRCNRLPCPFLHDVDAKAAAMVLDKGDKKQQQHRNNYIWKKPNTPAASYSVCKHFRVGRNCPYGDKCRFLHSWFLVSSSKDDDDDDAAFSLVTSLQEPQTGADQGHNNNNNNNNMMMITGIALPTGSDKLYTGSKDGSLRAWNCHTGTLAGTIHLGLGAQVGCIITQGHWIFVGTPNAVKAWNVQEATVINSADDLITLTCTSSSSSPANSSAGQVYALTEACETLFAGTHSGQILAWRYTTLTSDNTIHPVASLSGHTLGVISLAVAPHIQRLYSASMDHTIRVWDLSTAACIQTLTDHTSAVMSLILWDNFLLSCSLDQTIKAWHATDTTGDMQAVYTHTEENGLLTLSGMLDPQGKPVLLCSSNDDTVRLYNLPAFTERGILFSKAEVRTVHASPGGGPLFFTGDGAGELRVWTWLPTTDDNNQPVAASAT